MSDNGNGAREPHGRIQLMLPHKAERDELIQAGKLPADARLMAWQWEPIIAVTRLAIGSDTFAHCCPWSPGNQPASLPLMRMEPGWWLAPDWPHLERMIADMLRGAGSPLVAGH
jgi:hypothetical protein